MELLEISVILPEVNCLDTILTASTSYAQQQYMAKQGRQTCIIALHSDFA
jgi:hypothetical protein